MILLAALSACNLAPGTGSNDSPAGDIPIEWMQSSPAPELPDTASIPGEAPSRLLTICLAEEPVSLFLYADGSVAARSIRQAIYDGPFDILGFDLSPVILTQKPGTANGDAFFESVSLQPGDQIVDASGNLANLAEGVIYAPSGCMDAACTTPYAGEPSVQIDQFVVRFRLIPGIQWSDGAPLTADDSLYAYELAEKLYPRLRADLIARTAAYQALDESTLEWRGVPGYRRADYATYFFSPLPRHAWGQLSLDELFTADIANRTPIGWGPYVIDEWTPGDHISLRRNPNYFRSEQGLPAFDKLVYRFVSGRDQALDALLAGECDYLDENYSLETEQARMREFQDAGKIALAVETGTSWEQLAFGIASLDPEQPAFFQAVETRQAVAQCVNRERLVQDLFLGLSLVPDTYLHPAHPLANPDVRRYAFDPAAASTLLEAVGWLDEDGNPATPRVAMGVAGVPDGTPLKLALLTTDEPHKQQAAKILQESLAECGIALEVNAMPWETLLAPGPQGPIFGRRFTLAQYGWISALYPPCSLYITAEIPGPYPEHPKGWGGANASGFSNPGYDRTCLDALAVLPEMPEYRAFHNQAQQIYAEQLPSVPLYVHLKMIATRPDLCGLRTDPSADSALWNLENLDYGEGCG